jgi:hypothetical protein
MGFKRLMFLRIILYMERRFLKYYFEYQISEGCVLMASSFGGGREEADRR